MAFSWLKFKETSQLKEEALAITLQLTACLSRLYKLIVLFLGCLLKQCAEAAQEAAELFAGRGHRSCPPVAGVLGRRLKIAPPPRLVCQRGRQPRNYPLHPEFLQEPGRRFAGEIKKMKCGWAARGGQLRPVSTQLKASARSHDPKYLPRNPAAQGPCSAGRVPRWDPRLFGNQRHALPGQFSSIICQCSRTFCSRHSCLMFHLRGSLLYSHRASSPLLPSPLGPSGPGAEPSRVAVK